MQAQITRCVSWCVKAYYLVVRDTLLCVRECSDGKRPAIAFARLTNGKAGPGFLTQHTIVTRTHIRLTISAGLSTSAVAESSYRESSTLQPRTFRMSRVLRMQSRTVQKARQVTLSLALFVGIEFV